jgi:hypothetical protein
MGSFLVDQVLAMAGAEKARQSFPLQPSPDHEPMIGKKMWGLSTSMGTDESEREKEKVC